jgi:hypothetical protein
LPVQAFRLGTVIALALAALLGAAAALRIPELADALAMVQRRLRRRSGD